MKARSRTLLIGATVAFALFAVMALIVAGTEPWQGDSGSEAATESANDTQAVVDSLFGPNVIAFEVLGILLTAIMIGALVIARPLDAQSDSERYSHPTAAQVAESDHASNVKETMARTAAASDPREVPK
ncbi:MAG: NADH-quinone oxidoreductase subunit J [Candidatus Thermoplasmatota archaeon]